LDASDLETTLAHLDQGVSTLFQRRDHAGPIPGVAANSKTAGIAEVLAELEVMDQSIYTNRGALSHGHHPSELMVVSSLFSTA